MRLLGHLVGSGIKRADPQHLTAIAAMPRPTIKKEVRRLLVLDALGYYHEYIPQFSYLVEPFTDLTSKKSANVVVSEDEHERTFIALDRKLCMPPVLALPEIGRPFVLHTDASGSTVVAALGQTQHGKMEQPIAFASQKLSGSQLGCAIIEKEAYAIIWALNRFREIVYGSHITVMFDRNPLQYIRECSTKSAKLLHWSLSLQEYDVDNKYTKGTQNVVADYRHMSEVYR